MTKRSSLSKIVAACSLLVFAVSTTGCSKKGGPLSDETAKKLIAMCDNIKKQMDTACPIPQMQSLLTDAVVQGASSSDPAFPLTLDCRKNVSVLVEQGKHDAEELPSLTDSCIKMYEEKDKKINCVELNLCMTAVLTKSGKMAAGALKDKAEAEKAAKEKSGK